MRMNLLRTTIANSIRKYLNMNIGLVNYLLFIIGTIITGLEITYHHRAFTEKNDTNETQTQNIKEKLSKLIK